MPARTPVAYNDGELTNVPVNTLFVVHDSPYPARSGSPLRCWQNINVMAENGPVYVFSVGLREQKTAAMPVVKRWVHVDPADFPASRSGIVRRALRLARQRQYPVDDDSADERINLQLQRFIDDVRPDVVVLSHWQSAFPDALKGCPHVIVDAHNIQSFLAREVWSTNESHLAALRRNIRLWKWRRRERDLFRRARTIWVTSDDDARLLSQLDAGLPKPVVWPNVVDVDAYAPVRDGTIAPPRGLALEGGPTIAFVGFYAWPPNERAALVLIEQIFPRVRAVIPRARLLLVGKEPTAAMLAAAATDPRIVVTGTVDDVRPYLVLADVCVVPLTEGGGTRLKILEAFAAHVPVVSTAKGAEGLDVASGKHIAIADDPASIAEAAIALLSEPERSRMQVQEAFAFVSSSYSRDTLRRRLAGATAERSRRDMQTLV